MWLTADAGGYRQGGTHIRMDRDREDEIIVFPIEIVKMISPDILDIAWVDEPVAVRSCFDEHPG